MPLTREIVNDNSRLFFPTKWFLITMFVVIIFLAIFIIAWQNGKMVNMRKRITDTFIRTTKNLTEDRTLEYLAKSINCLNNIRNAITIDV